MNDVSRFKALIPYRMLYFDMFAAYKIRSAVAVYIISEDIQSV
jgi:hypothetical protein